MANDNCNNLLYNNNRRFSKNTILDMTKVVFELLWSRNERMTQLLAAYAPRRLEQEQIFRGRGKDCRYYTALCKTIVAEVIEGKLAPEFMELIDEEIQHAGSPV